MNDLIQTAFQQWLLVVYKDVEVSDTQKREMRDVFFSGSSYIFHTMMDQANKGEVDKLDYIIQNLTVELNQFMEEKIGVKPENVN